MPGTSPRMATSRSLLRHKPNLRNTPRGRPVRVQRLRWRLGLALRGSCCTLRRAAMRSSSDSLALLMMAVSSARLAAYFATSLARLASRFISASFAMAPSVLEREFESAEEGLGLLVGLRSRRDADVHPAQRIDLVVLDLGEDDLLLNPDVVVAASVEALAGDAPEIANPRHGDAHQAVEEFVHAIAAQRDHAADRVTLANFEAGDRLARLRDDRLLAGDLGHVAESVLEYLLVPDGLADTHVQRDLGDARHFHDRLVAELRLKLADHGLFVVFLQAGHVASLCLNHFAVRLEYPHLAAIVELFESDAVRLAGTRIEQGNVGDVDRHFLVDDAAGLPLHRIGLGVFLDLVDAFDDDLLVIDAAQHRAALALVLAGYDDHAVALANLVHDLTSENFRRQRNDLHEAFGPELAGHRAEDAGADRLKLVVEQDRGIAIELDQRAVGAPHALGGAHHHRVVDLALLDASARRRVLDTDLDDVADAGVASLGAAEHLDAHHRTRARIVGDVQHRLHLNHVVNSPT